MISDEYLVNNEKNKIATVEKDNKDYILSGDEYYLSGYFNEALKEYKKGEVLEPCNSDYKYRIGKALLSLNDLKEGHRYFQMAVELSPEEGEFHNALSYSFYILGNLKKSFRHCYKSVKLSPHTSLYRHNLGAIIMEMIKEKVYFKFSALERVSIEYEKGGTGFTELKTISRNFYTLGTFYFMNGEIDKAGRWYEKSLLVYPQLKESHANIGIIALLEGKYELAIERFEKALSLDKTLISAHRGLALCYEKLGNINKAILEYETLLKINPNDRWARKYLDNIYDSLRVKDMTQSFLHLSRIYMDDGEFEKAAYELKKALRMGEDSFELVSSLNKVGFCLLVKGNDVEALRIYERSAELIEKFYCDLRKKSFFSIKERLQDIHTISMADLEGIICYRTLRNIYDKKQLYKISSYWHGKLSRALRQMVANLKFYDYRISDRLIREIEECIKTSFSPSHEFYSILGEIYIYEGNINSAISCYKKAVDLHPDEASYRIIMGHCYFNINKYREASVEYSHVIRIKSFELIKYIKRLKILFKFLHPSELHDMEVICVNSIKLNPLNWPSYFILGELYLSVNKVDYAIKALENALRLNFSKKIIFSLAEVYMNKGILHYKDGNFMKAKNIFLTAYRMNNKNNRADKNILYLGYTYYHLKEFDCAIDCFLKIINRNSVFKVKAYQYLGLIYGCMEIRCRADYYNEKFLEEMELKSRLYFNFRDNKKLYEEKDGFNLSEEYERAICLAPDNMLYYIILVNLYIKSGNLDLLVSKFENKIKYNLFYANIFIQRGKFYFKEKQFEKAGEDYSKAFDAGLRTVELCIVLNELALIYYKNNDVKEAINLLNKSILCSADNPEPYYNLGIIYNSLGVYENAIDYVRMAILKEKNFEKKAIFLNAIGSIYLAKGEFNEAFANFNEALEFDSNFIGIYYNLGIACCKINLLDKGKDYFLKVVDMEPCYLNTIKYLSGQSKFTKRIIFADEPYRFNSIKYLRDLSTDREKMEWQKKLTEFAGEKLSNIVSNNNVSSGEFEYFLVEYEKGRVLCRGDAKFYKLIGELYVKENNIPMAKEAISKATSLDPSFAYLHIMLSNLYIKEKQFSMAREEAEKALEGGVKSLDLASVCIKLGNKFFNDGELKKAKEEYERAFTMGNRSKDLGLKLNKIGVEYSSEFIDDAIGLFKKAVEIISDNYIFYKNLAIMYQRKELFKEAVQCFKKALDLQPGDVKIMEKLKSLYYENGNLAETLHILEALLNLSSNNANYLYNIGKIYGELGKYAKALDYYKKAINLKKDWFLPYLNMGFIYIEQGKYDEGKIKLEQSLKLNDKNLKTYTGLFHISSVQGDELASENYYKKVIELWEEETQKKDIKSDLYMVMGDLFFYNMELNRAIEYYNKFLDSKDKNNQVILHLGKVLVLSGEFIEGEKELRKLTDNNMEYPEAYFYLGKIYRLRGQSHEAVDYYRNVIRLNPDWVYKAYVCLAELYDELDEKYLALQCKNKIQELKGKFKIPIQNIFDVNKLIETLEKDLREM